MFNVPDEYIYLRMDMLLKYYSPGFMSCSSPTSELYCMWLLNLATTALKERTCILKYVINCQDPEEAAIHKSTYMPI